MVRVYENIRPPLVEDLGDQGLNLLGFQLQVVPIHVEAFVVGSAPNLGPIGVDGGHDEDHGLIQQGLEIAHDQVPHDLHGRIFSRHLPTMDIVHDEDHGFVGVGQVSDLEHRRVGQNAENHVPAAKSLGDLHHVHELGLGFELVDEFHEGFVQGAALLIVGGFSRGLEPPLGGQLM